MNSRQALVAGNWKMNGTRSSIAALAKEIAEGASNIHCDVVVCPVSVHLSDVQSILKSSVVQLGAQNCSDKKSGAYTGEMSASMLSEFACQYVIVGHSERRQLFGDTSEVVANKVAAVLAENLIPILCVGETLEERNAGQLQSVLNKQIDAVIEQVGVSIFAKIVIAYEPVWAIGTGVTASSEQAQEVHQMIREKLAVLDSAVAEQTRILYGGSVKPDNAKELFSQPDIDGGLIGGAALSSESFLAICQAAGPVGS